MLSKHWTTLVTWAFLLFGFIFNLGFQSRDIKNTKEDVEAIKTLQKARADILIAMQQDILRLQLARDIQGSSLLEIKTEISEIRRLTQQTDKAIAVIVKQLEK